MSFITSVVVYEFLGFCLASIFVRFMLAQELRWHESNIRNIDAVPTTVKYRLHYESKSLSEEFVQLDYPRYALFNNAVIVVLVVMTLSLVSQVMQLN